MITSAELSSRMKLVSVVLTGGQIARASKVRWAPSLSDNAAALRGARDCERRNRAAPLPRWA